MNISYPAFAFSSQMQVVLFFVNLVATSLSYFWGANLLLQIFKTELSWKRKWLFSLLAASTLNILVVYGLSFINGLATGISLLYIGKFALLTQNVLPFAYFVLYIVGVRTLKLPPFKCIPMMRYAYIYFICTSICNKIIARGFLFPTQTDPRGWNYLIDIMKLTGGTILLYGVYRITQFIMRRSNYGFVFPDNVVVGNVPKSLFQNFLICCLFYVFATSVYHYADRSVLPYILLLIIFLGYLYLGLSLKFNHIQRQQLLNSREHIAELIKSIEEFRGVKHDFNNILQTYSGFLEVGAYDSLKQYHAKTVGVLLSAEEHMDFSKRISENPSFFSLLIQKLDYARRLAVHLEARALCNLTDVYIDSLDFSRIMAVFLDNAIEAAAQTPRKFVSLSSQAKRDGSKLIILSNDAENDIDVKSTALPGYTTKTGHMGLGLGQARTILSKYGNVTLNIISYKKTFTVYLEFRCPDTAT